MSIVNALGMEEAFFIKYLIHKPTWFCFHRSANPNALFLLRDKSFLDAVPADKLHRFRDDQPIAVEHLRVQ